MSQIVQYSTWYVMLKYWYSMYSGIGPSGIWYNGI